MQQRDIRAVKNALYRYNEEPLVPENEVLDLVQWWDVSGLTVPMRKVLLSLFRNRTMKWPTRFSFPSFLMLLPVQAPAVPCQRIFSSSKETCALRCIQAGSLLSASTLEVLQVLKQLYKDENLQ
jgi:hypothetical protein